MVKTQANKKSNKPDEQASENVAAAAPAVAAAPLASPAKKDTPRSKKQALGKNGSLLPSAYKLEQLKLAVTAAGSAEKLLSILHHVEEAGGRTEVIESIETYRVLKTVLDEK
jgi:hypothetical protein